MKRRIVLHGLAGALPAGLLVSNQGFAASRQTSPVKKTDRDYFKELGVVSFINAAGPYSMLSGAQMYPQVIEAMSYAKQHTARMSELHDAIGERIALLSGAEAAMVPAGATSGMILGTAACLAGSDEKKIAQLPDLTGMKSEVIMQKGQTYSYMRALRNCGVKVILIETEDELIKALNDKTAMLHFAYAYRNRGKISAERFLEIGRKYGIPVFCDAATTVPPATNILRIVDIGFDLVCFSGGKGLRGPYNGGLLLGRKDLISAARKSAAPNDIGIGRGMKVSKEVLLGILVALETSLNFDHEADRKQKNAWLEYIAREVTQLEGITTELVFNQSEFHPNLRFIWNKNKFSATAEQIKQSLRNGKPSIEVAALSLSEGHFEISAWMMEVGQEKTVAKQIGEVFKSFA